VKERFFEAYLKEGKAIGEREVLARLAVEAGLPEEEVIAVLASDRYAREVRDDEAYARSLGVNGVPFFVFGEKYAMSGAQPADVILRALEQAWESAGAIASEGAVCGPEGCA
jgi:predicted DsbA family dithiol-disulfide isomerase